MSRVKTVSVTQWLNLRTTQCCEQNRTATSMSTHEPRQMNPHRCAPTYQFREIGPSVPPPGAPLGPPRALPGASYRGPWSHACALPGPPGSLLPRALAAPYGTPGSLPWPFHVPSMDPPVPTGGHPVGPQAPLPVALWGHPGAAKPPSRWPFGGIPEPPNRPPGGPLVASREPPSPQAPLACAGGGGRAPSPNVSMAQCLNGSMSQWHSGSMSLWLGRPMARFPNCTMSQATTTLQRKMSFPLAHKGQRGAAL